MTIFDALFAFYLRAAAVSSVSRPVSLNFTYCNRIAFEKTTHPANGVVNHLEAVAQENETAAVDEGEEMEEEEQEQEQEQEEAQIGGESEEEEEEEDVSATIYLPFRRGRG